MQESCGIPILNCWRDAEVTSGTSWCFLLTRAPRVGIRPHLLPDFLSCSRRSCGRGLGRPRLAAHCGRMGTMGRKLLTAWVGALLLAAGGCMAGPLQDNPVFVRPNANVTIANPVWLPGAGQPAYYNEKVFESVLDIIVDYLESCCANRYDGQMEPYSCI